MLPERAQPCAPGNVPAVPGQAESLNTTLHSGTKGDDTCAETNDDAQLNLKVDLKKPAPSNRLLTKAFEGF